MATRPPSIAVAPLAEASLPGGAGGSRSGIRSRSALHLPRAGRARRVRFLRWYSGAIVRLGRGTGAVEACLGGAEAGGGGGRLAAAGADDAPAECAAAGGPPAGAAPGWARLATSGSCASPAPPKDSTGAPSAGRTGICSCSVLPRRINAWVSGAHWYGLASAGPRRRPPVLPGDPERDRPALLPAARLLRRDHGGRLEGRPASLGDDLGTAGSRRRLTAGRVRTGRSPPGGGSGEHRRLTEVAPAATVRRTSGGRARGGGGPSRRPPAALVTAG